jgi:hypothetical protein
MLLFTIRVFHFLFFLYMIIPVGSFIHFFCLSITLITQYQFKSCLISRLEKKINNNINVPFIYEWTFPIHQISNPITFMQYGFYYLLCIWLMDASYILFY